MGSVSSQALAFFLKLLPEERAWNSPPDAGRFVPAILPPNVAGRLVAPSRWPRDVVPGVIRFGSPSRLVALLDSGRNEKAPPSPSPPPPDSPSPSWLANWLMLWLSVRHTKAFFEPRSLTMACLLPVCDMLDQECWDIDMDDVRNELLCVKVRRANG